MPERRGEAARRWAQLLAVDRRETRLAARATTIADPRTAHANRAGAARSDGQNAAPARGPGIETVALAKRLGAVDAVAGVDLAVPIGSVFGFPGPNGAGKFPGPNGAGRFPGPKGAGKTTTIRMLVGLIRPPSGSAALPGCRAAGSCGPRQRRGAGAHGLGPAASRKAGGSSTGMRQRLAIALATLHRRSLAILDELTHGPDRGGVVEVRAATTELSRDGTTVFPSSHVPSEVEQLCDQVVAPARGRIVASGAPAGPLDGPGSLRVAFDTAGETDAARRMLADDGTAATPGRLRRRGARRRGRSL